VYNVTLTTINTKIKISDNLKELICPEFLLMNISFTTDTNKDVNVHLKAWYPFTEALLNELYTNIEYNLNIIIAYGNIPRNLCIKLKECTEKNLSVIEPLYNKKMIGDMNELNEGIKSISMSDDFKQIVGYIPS